jgi:hypothetical protein
LLAYSNTWTCVYLLHSWTRRRWCGSPLADDVLEQQIHHIDMARQRVEFAAQHRSVSTKRVRVQVQQSKCPQAEAALVGVGDMLRAVEGADQVCHQFSIAATREVQLSGAHPNLGKQLQSKRWNSRSAYRRFLCFTGLVRSAVWRNIRANAKKKGERVEHTPLHAAL